MRKERVNKVDIVVIAMLYVFGCIGLGMFIGALIVLIRTL